MLEPSKLYARNSLGGPAPYVGFRTAGLAPKVPLHYVANIVRYFTSLDPPVVILGAGPVIMGASLEFRNDRRPTLNVDIDQPP